MKKLTVQNRRLRKLSRVVPDFKRNQQGFIPMMLTILGVIALIIFLVYSRVASVNH